MLGLLLYFGLTTGCGLRTLGEEYCNMIQVTDGVGTAPPLSKRMLLVLLQSLGPHLAETMVARLDRMQAESAPDGVGPIDLGELPESSEDCDEDESGSGSGASWLSRQFTKTMRSVKSIMNDSLASLKPWALLTWPRIRSSYRVLGLLLMIQIAVMALLQETIPPRPPAATSSVGRVWRSGAGRNQSVPCVDHAYCCLSSCPSCTQISDAAD
eukprot:gene6539-3184_t